MNMKQIGRRSALAAFSAVMLLAVRCASLNPANTSEVGNPKLSGHIADGRTGTPAESATVRLYPMYLNKMAQALGKTATGAPALDSTRTDFGGFYCFDSLPEGFYSLEAGKIDGSDTLCMRRSSVRFIETRDIGWDTLRLPGSLRGKITVPAGESAQNITCYISGTSYMAITNDTGAFRITGIPAGTYSVSFSSSRFNDTTLNSKTVAAAAETDIGTVMLGFDMTKNEHDVWGVFDSAAEYHAIGRIEARVTGDNIPADTPRIFALDWRPDVVGYSGFIYVPQSGFFWKVAIQVFDTLNRRTGFYEIQINRSTGDIAVPKFDPRNSVPAVSLSDTTVSIYDTIRLSPAISLLADDSVMSMEWKIGSAGTFTPVTSKDTLLTASSDSGVIVSVFRVTDRFNNTVSDTVVDSVIVDAPVFDIFISSTNYHDTGTNVTVPVGTSMTFEPQGVLQRFGSIVNYTWSYVNDTVWTDSGANLNYLPMVFDHLGQQRISCTIRDDDGNEASDTVNILVATEIGGILPMNAVLLESASPYVATSDLLVQTGGELTIEPGAVVRFNAGVGMTVNGAIKAEGTSSNKIVLRTNSFDTTASWDLSVGGSSCIMHYCDIVSGIVGFSAASNVISRSSFFSSTISVGEPGITADSCRFSNTSIDISSWADEGAGNIKIRYCDFNRSSGCTIFGNDAVVTGNTFTDAVSAGSAGSLMVQGYGLTVSANRVTDGRELAVQGSGVLDGNHVQGGAVNGIKVNGWSGTFWPRGWTITNNTVMENEGNGICISDDQMEYGSWSYLVQNNTISNNAGSGALIDFIGTRSWTCIVRNNDLSFNGSGAAPSGPPYFNAGIVCENPAAAIDSNIIADNNVGVTCASGDILTNNNIHGNTDYDFRVLVNDAGDVYAPGNWWGTADTAAIQAGIYDYHDDSGLGELLIDPVAIDSIPGAGPR